MCSGDKRCTLGLHDVTYGHPEAMKELRALQSQLERSLARIAELEALAARTSSAIDADWTRVVSERDARIAELEGMLKAAQAVALDDAARESAGVLAGRVAILEAALRGLVEALPRCDCGKRADSVVASLLVVRLRCAACAKFRNVGTPQWADAAEHAERVLGVSR